MVCTYCGSATSVTNSRHQKRANRVWRRRQCVACGNLVTTLESLDYAASVSFQRQSGPLEPFSRDILFVSIYDSVRHRKTAVADATALTETVLARLFQYLNTAQGVSRDSLTADVTAILSRFDSVAGVHYQAFHPVRS